MAETAWTVRDPWDRTLYGFEKQKWRAEKVKERFKRREIPTVVRKEPLEGLYEELTEDK